MKNLVGQAVTLASFLLLHFSEAVDSNINRNSKSSRAQSKVFGKRPGGGLVSFNSDDGKLRVSLKRLFFDICN